MWVANCFDPSRSSRSAFIDSYELHVRSLRSGDVLLGHAVERAQAQHQIAAVNGSPAMVRKSASQCVQSSAVIGVVERGHQHQAVGDIEIRIARRQALSLE